MIGSKGLLVTNCAGVIMRQDSRGEEFGAVLSAGAESSAQDFFNSHGDQHEIISF